MIWILKNLLDDHMNPLRTEHVTQQNYVYITVTP